jgi:hypothetical protein
MEIVLFVGLLVLFGLIRARIGFSPGDKVIGVVGRATGLLDDGRLPGVMAGSRA